VPLAFKRKDNMMKSFKVIICGLALFPLIAHSPSHTSESYFIKLAGPRINSNILQPSSSHIEPSGGVRQGQYFIMTREQFKNWLFHHNFSRNIRLIQHHHTWMPSYKHFYGSNHFEMLKGMETYHRTKMGWENIAQNITTFPDGKIAVCRPFDQAPEGSIGQQANSVGLAIENIGNFDNGHDVMSKEQKETIVFITALLCIKFGLTPSVDTITYHHWWNYKTKERVLDNSKEYEVKSCPGTGFFGGNSTLKAKTSFFPLVSKKIQEIRASLK
jgi:hypothetical protein